MSALGAGLTLNTGAGHSDKSLSKCLADPEGTLTLGVGRLDRTGFGESSVRSYFNCAVFHLPMGALCV